MHWTFRCSLLLTHPCHLYLTWWHSVPRLIYRCAVAVFHFPPQAPDGDWWQLQVLTTFGILTVMDSALTLTHKLGQSGGLLQSPSTVQCTSLSEHFLPWTMILTKPTLRSGTLKQSFFLVLDCMLKPISSLDYH